MAPDTPPRAPQFLTGIAEHYEKRLARFGALAQGVLWRNAEGQKLRFDVLVRIFEPGDRHGGITVNDLGCGYGAFFDYLKGRPVMAGSRYTGYDICAAMVETATGRIHDPRARFVHSAAATETADYSFASGTFNLKADVEAGPWNAYVKASLADLWRRTNKGLAFNMLSVTSTRREEGLYYADGAEFLEFCAATLSRNAVLADDYPLREWTIFVRR